LIHTVPLHYIGLIGFFPAFFEKQKPERNVDNPASFTIHKQSDKRLTNYRSDARRLQKCFAAGKYLSVH
jgi:hypothetical protein